MILITWSSLMVKLSSINLTSLKRAKVKSLMNSLLSSNKKDGKNLSNETDSFFNKCLFNLWMLWVSKERWGNWSPHGGLVPWWG